MEEGALGQGYRYLLEARKDKETYCPWASTVEYGLANTLMLAQWDLCHISDLQKHDNKFVLL